CGIPPGQKFIYKYHLTQPGTYWLHSHDKHQNADGLRTPLIIYDRDGPYKYDSEYLFFFEDWYTESFISRLERTLDTTKPPPPRASGYALINGFSGNYTKPIYFEPGKIYRLRLVNMSVNEWFQFSLPGHSLCVIETDGEYTQRKCVEGIELAPAQRYSVLVTAHDTSDFNYQYKVAMYTSLQSPVPGSVPPVFLGSVVYSASSPLWPASPSIENMVFASDIDLRSHSLEPPLPVTRSLNLTLGFGLFSNNQSLFVINDTPYGLPKVPTLFTALTMGKLAFDPRVYGKQANAVVLNYLDAVEITINNPTNRAHPMHIHNRSFQVYEFGPIGTNALNASAVQTNAIAPLKRDTVVVPGDKYVKIRYRADNPGVSLLHCHIDVHGALGMVMTI
ncbi:ferroxidase fet3, partial [Coemansia sp. RSA 2599]